MCAKLTIMGHEINCASGLAQLFATLSVSSPELNASGLAQLCAAFSVCGLDLK